MLQTKHWVSILRSLDYRREMLMKALSDFPDSIMVDTWQKVVACVNETIDIIKQEQPEAYEERN